MSTAETVANSKLISDAICESIEFEKLMDQIDFESWIEKVDPHDKFEDTTDNLESQADKEALNNYKLLTDRAKGKCQIFIDPSLDKLSEEAIVKSEELLIKYLVHCLFSAKLNRLDARRSSSPYFEQNKYVDATAALNKAFARIPPECLKKPRDGDRNKKFDLLLVLLYNDLSICYSGFKNSSISRGFAEESIRILSEDSDFISFKVNKNKFDDAFLSKDKEKLRSYEQALKQAAFISSKKYELYTFALFSKGIAEFRSFLKDESERTFNEILFLVDKYNCPANPDYFSAIVRLAALLNDLSRSKEAILIIKKMEDTSLISNSDRRWAEGMLEKASAYIDQGYFEDAKNTLEKIAKFRNFSEEEARHSEQYLNGLIYYGRSFLEEEKNHYSKSVNIDKKDGSEDFLEKAKKYFEEALKLSEKRKQKSLIQKASKYLAEVYKMQKKKPEEVLDFYAVALSRGEIKTFNGLISNDYFIKNCDDIDILENLSDLLFEDIMKNEVECNPADPTISLCLKLIDKLKDECVKKEKMSLLEKSQRRKEELERHKTCDIPTSLSDKPSFEEQYGLLTGAKESPESGGLLKTKQIKDRLESNEFSFDKVLFGRTDKANINSLVELVLLRRWNSFSPGLSKKYVMSLGGGYLLRILAPEFQELNNKKTGENPTENWFNLVIDPGYNFLLNFHNEGFHIEDIDAVLVTHSHPDHCAELSSIMELLMQVNKRVKRSPKIEGERKRIFLLLSRGVYKKFSSYIQDWKGQLKDVLILDNETNWPESDQKREFGIRSLTTAHSDLGGERSVGVIINIKNETELSIGFTSDTPWRNYICDSFSECDILCLHMGGIKDFEIGYDKNNIFLEKPDDRYKEIKRRIKEVNHLLFYGSIDIIKNYRKPGSLIIVGEFGEELKYGLRTDLVKKLNLHQNSKKPLCIPGDTGLYIILTKNEKMIKCDFCSSFISPESITTFSYGLVDSLHYICQACNCTLTESQKRTIVEYKLTKL